MNKIQTEDKSKGKKKRDDDEEFDFLKFQIYV